MDTAMFRFLEEKLSYCHREYMDSVKGDRLQLRVDAASADEVLAGRHTIHLSPDAASAFIEALNRPARVNERLTKALQRPAKFSWLD